MNKEIGWQERTRMMTDGELCEAIDIRIQDAALHSDAGKAKINFYIAEYTARRTAEILEKRGTITRVQQTGWQPPIRKQIEGDKAYSAGEIVRSDKHGNPL